MRHGVAVLAMLGILAACGHDEKPRRLFYGGSCAKPSFGLVPETPATRAVRGMPVGVHFLRGSNPYVVDDVFVPGPTT